MNGNAKNVSCMHLSAQHGTSPTYDSLWGLILMFCSLKEFKLYQLLRIVSNPQILKKFEHIFESYI
jgi:hypothetical protein